MRLKEIESNLITELNDDDLQSDEEDYTESTDSDSSSSSDHDAVVATAEEVEKEDGMEICAGFVLVNISRIVLPCFMKTHTFRVWFKNHMLFIITAVLNE